MVARGTIDGRTIDGVAARAALVGQTVHVDALAAGIGARASASAEIDLGDQAITLTTAHVAALADLHAFTPVVTSDGPIDATVDAHGQLWPAIRLAAAGTVDGNGVRARDYSIHHAHATFAVTGLPRELGGTAKLVATDVRRGADRVGDLGRDRDSRGRARLRCRGAPQPGAARPGNLDVPARVALGDTIRIALGQHRIEGPAQRWDGAGGTVEISDDRITAHALGTSGPAGNIALASGSLQRTGPHEGDLVAAATASGVDLAGVERLVGIPIAWRGSVDVRADVTRHGTRWAGNATVTARQVVRDVGAPPIDGSLRAEVSSSRITVELDAAAAGVGHGAAALDVKPPAAITSIAAWMAITRASVYIGVRVTHVDVDLAALGNAAPSHAAGRPRRRRPHVDRSRRDRRVSRA